MMEKYLKEVKEIMLESNMKLVEFKDFKNSVSKITGECITCGHLRRNRAYEFKKPYKCVKCFPYVKEPKKNLKYLEETKKIMHENSCYVLDESNYINSNSIITSKCKKCENIWDARTKDLKRGRSCPVCANEKRKENLNKFDPLYLDKILSNAEDGKFYKFLDEYSGDNKNLHSIKHLECGNIYKVRPNDFQQGYRCPTCSFKASKAEKTASYFFSSNNIVFLSEFTININNRSLRVDFYLPEYDLYLEIDGEQHFNENTFYYSEMGRYRDKLKNSYFSESRLNFIRIPYIGKSKISRESILKHILNDIKNEILDDKYLEENNCLLITSDGFHINVDNYFELNNLVTDTLYCHH